MRFDLSNCFQFVCTLILSSLFGISIGGSIAASQPVPGVIDKDDRRPIDSQVPPWNAVGKIYAPRFGRVVECTGTLIEPNVVVTAAHCLFHKQSGKPLRPSEIHFLAGYRREKYLAHAVAKCVNFHPDYNFRKKLSAKSVSNDVAFLVLNKPLKTPAASFYDKARIGKSDSLVHAGYGQDRRYMLAGHTGCKAKFYRNNTYFTDCDTAEGASGGPVFVKKDGRYAIAAVMSSNATLNSPEGKKPYNLATSILRDRDRLAEIKKCR